MTTAPARDESGPDPSSGFHVVFSLDDILHALPVRIVERVYRAVEMTPLDAGSPLVSGVIVIHGQGVPVFDIRRRLGLPAKEIEVDDHLFILNDGGNRMACFVDRIREIRIITGTEISALDPSASLPAPIVGIADIPGGTVFVEDGERIFSEVFRPRKEDGR